MRPGRRDALLLGLLVAVGGCITSRTPPPPGPADGGRLPDGALPGLDPDGDGLCSAREAELGTDPTRADTDGDGLPDGVEFVASLGPADRADPPLRQVAFLPLRSGAETALVVEFAVRGRGESYQAALEAPRFVLGTEGSAHDYFAELRAVGAFPPEAAAEVDPGAAEVRGVVGRALLTFEVRFRPAERETGGCARAYPLRLALKRSDGASWRSPPLLLVVAPEERAPWCPWEGSCI